MLCCHPQLGRRHITFGPKRVIVPHLYELLKTLINTGQKYIMQAKKVDFIVDIKDVVIFQIRKKLVVEHGASTEDVTP